MPGLRKTKSGEQERAMKIWIAVSLAATLSCSVMASQGQFETAAPTATGQTTQR